MRIESIVAVCAILAGTIGATVVSAEAKPMMHHTMRHRMRRHMMMRHRMMRHGM